MSTEVKFSEAEIKMFEALVQGHLLELNALNPLKVYTIAFGEAFTENKTGPPVEALRRAAKALSSVKIYRLTPEFDKLVAFETPDDEKPQDQKYSQIKDWI